MEETKDKVNEIIKLVNAKDPTYKSKCQEVIDILQNVKKDGIKITKRFFEVEYKDKKDMFEAVITVFSTDEAKNIIDFTEKVNNVLKKGGVWIGKLNNIFSNYGGFDLTWEEWKHVILKSGFEIVREETPVLPYCKIEGQSSPHTLGTIFFAAKKI